MVRFLKGIPLARRWAVWLRQTLHSHESTGLQQDIGNILKRKRNVFFVQVGSNTGSEGDPIHDLIISHSRWSGMFIEPVKYAFDKLKGNYGEASRFIFENVAISTKTEARKFFYVGEAAKTNLAEQIPSWYDQLGSFDKNHIIKHLNGVLEPYIIEEEVECMSLAQILAKHQVTSVDLLHIDTEGFDYEVLKQINFEEHQPAVVLYEHQHLSVQDRINAEKLLTLRGYDLKLGRILNIV